MAHSSLTPIWKGIALEALSLLRGLLKLNGTQSEAWDMVTGLIQGL